MTKNKTISDYLTADNFEHQLPTDFRAQVACSSAFKSLPSTAFISVEVEIFRVYLFTIRKTGM